MLKFLVLVAVLAAVWFGLKWIARVDAARRRWEEIRKTGTAGEAETGQKQHRVAAAETERCAKCGAYVPTGSGAGCGRDDCPYT